MVTITNQIKACLSLCGITVAAQQNNLIDQEGLSSFDSFCIIQAKNFDMVASRATKHTPPFTLGVVKIRSLRALRFWIEDQIRFDATATIRHLQFTTARLREYILIGDNEEQDETEIPIGPVHMNTSRLELDAVVLLYLMSSEMIQPVPMLWILSLELTRSIGMLNSPELFLTMTVPAFGVTCLVEFNQRMDGTS